MSTRGQVLLASENLVTETCYSCGVLFAMTTDFRARRMEDHHGFYCPNGHCQSYTGKTEAQKAREAQRVAEEESARLQRSLEYARTRQFNAEAETRRKARQLAATKGALTKARKRAAAGVCPCCPRTVVQMARHVQTKHPEYVADVGLEVALRAFTPVEP